jgi:DNA polymerase-1
MFKPLFEDETKVWIGQNIKYDMLMLKWYGFELKGDIFDTMLAHYVIEPEGKSNMDALSAKYLGYQPVSITELIGKKGKGQGTMRDVDVEKVKEYAGRGCRYYPAAQKYFLAGVKNQVSGKGLLRSREPFGKSIDRYGI